MSKATRSGSSGSWARHDACFSLPQICWKDEVSLLVKDIVL